MEKISVIIPCYSDSKTLSRAIESVLRQTNPVDEIIVVNDFSPETEQIESVLQYWPEVIYIKNTVNMGLAATRNVGANIAKNEIIAFLDADDEWHSQKVELQKELMASYSATTTGVERIYANKSESFEVKYHNDKRLLLIGDTDRLIWSNHLTGASMMIRRQVFLSIGGYDASLRSCEDYDFWFRLLKSNYVVCKINLPLYKYHFNPKGLSNDFSNICYWEIEVLKKFFSSSDISDSLKKRRDSVFAFWLFKHYARAAITYDGKLLQVTNDNQSKLLLNSPFLQRLLKFLNRTKLPWLYGYIYYH